MYILPIYTNQISSFIHPLFFDHNSFTFTISMVGAVPSTHTTTAIWDGSNELDVTAASQALRDGRLVAFPTETVYGLGANALDEKAVAGVYQAKGRPSDNPLIVHVASLDALRDFNLTPMLSPSAAALARSFWPGPLTMVLPLHANAKLAPLVTAGLKTVGVRIPRHPVAAALLAAVALPIAAPSANASGSPSPTCAQHVLRDLTGRIAGVVDGGAPPPHAVGVESTVVDVTDPHMFTILRPGSIGLEEVERISGVPVHFVSSTPERPPAPGMKYRHYAPVAPLRLVTRQTLASQVDHALESTLGNIGLLADTQLCSEYRHTSRVRVAPCGERGNVLSMARQLYAALRSFDQNDHPSNAVQLILAVKPDESNDPIAVAVMNRLTKAAGGNPSVLQP